MTVGTNLITDPAAWDDCYDDVPGAYMTSSDRFSIEGVPFHLTAFEVITDPTSGVQEAVINDEDLGRIHGALGNDGPWMTVDIAGRDYVIIADPYGA